MEIELDRVFVNEMIGIWNCVVEVFYSMTLDDCKKLIESIRN